METSIAENIRIYRKQRGLTQEQLSEALGVTAGAVYKWEAKLSIPELELIIQMADFFDVLPPHTRDFSRESGGLYACEIRTCMV